MPLRTERDGRVMTVTLDNAPRQFQSRAMTFELFELLKRLERDRSIGAVVITGAHPRSFLTHYDVAEILAGARVTPDVPPRVFGALLRVVGLVDRLPGGGRLLHNRRTVGLLANRRVHQVYLAMNEMDKVFIAAINGTAAAGGCELALACDIRLMAEGDFTIGLTEPVLGFNPGGGGGQRLARTVGSAHAVEMLLEARHYSPREAVAAGLVHRVVEPERLLEEAHATAARLARRSRRAIWASKRVAYRGPSSRWPGGFQLDRTGFLWGAVAPSTKRAMQAMLEQIESAPHDRPSPWHHPDQLRQWQEGTVADFSE
jgi:enoyl-CoA hydratase/carnithine racemase